MNLFSLKSACLCFLWSFLFTSVTSTEPIRGCVDPVFRDLVHLNRKVLAIGLVDGELALFASGTADTDQLDGGLQINVLAARLDALKADLNPVPLPSGVPRGPIKFACQDSSGTNLVVMSSSRVQKFSLATGNLHHVSMDGQAANNCFGNGSLHVTSNNPLNFYVISENGKVIPANFDDSNSIDASKLCHFSDSPGQLCRLGSSPGYLVMKPECQQNETELFFQNLIAGYIGDKAVYLFDSDGNVHGFSSQVLKPGNLQVEVYTKDIANFLTVKLPKFAPKPHYETWDDLPAWRRYILIGVRVAWLLILAFLVWAAIYLRMLVLRMRTRRELAQEFLEMVQRGKAQRWADESAAFAAKLAEARRGRKRPRPRSHSRSRSRSRSRSPRGRQDRCIFLAQPHLRRRVGAGVRPLAANQHDHSANLLRERFRQQHQLVPRTVLANVAHKKKKMH